MQITIRKIAKELNLAVSTVSKALRDSHEISEETKQKIFALARKLDYVPNAYAGSLKNRKTGNIAVVVPEVADSFFSDAINGIEAVAQQKGYHVMVYLTHECAERENSILRNLRNGRVDGILVSVSSGTISDSAVHADVAKHVPLIFFDRVCQDIDTPKIITDDFDSGYKATHHLIEKGCKEIVFLSFTRDLSIVDQRMAGFKQAIIDQRMEVRDDHIVVCSNNETRNREILYKLFTRDRKVDGVVSSVEKLAMQVYSVCGKTGLSIPRDVRVIAFSNLPIASLLAPSLSTITQPAVEMGKAAATLLFTSLEKKVDLKRESYTLPSTLYERDSTR